MLVSCPRPIMHAPVTATAGSVSVMGSHASSEQQQADVKSSKAPRALHAAAIIASSSSLSADNQPAHNHVSVMTNGTVDSTQLRTVPINERSKEQGQRDFYRWRPSSHLIAPKNWMNDPCGPCYDESTGLFHLLYQYNPHGATWGNMSWLHATSKDLVHWTHVAETPSLVPEHDFDAKGVFSGAMIPHGPKGEKGTLTVFYTAVSYLPIHFTKPYHWGCEKLAMAISVDGGISWQRSSSSVVLSSPPQEHHADLASWRDPFISAWPEMDVHLGLPHDTYLYGLVSGGLRNKTPTAFLYKIEKANLAKWTYISTIADVGLNFALSGPSKELAGGEMGRNWEVCNFFTLANTEQFLLMNVEGVGADLKSRHPMWTQVTLDHSSTPKQKVNFTPQTSGLVDHGCLYAATTFFHAKTNRRIMWGWVTEDDLAETRYDQQGWSGCISLPREIVHRTYKNVDERMTCCHPDIQSSFKRTLNDGDVCLSTVGFQPARETVALRKGAKHFTVGPTSFAGEFTLPVKSRSFELLLNISIKEPLHVNDEVGVLVAHSLDRLHGTKIVYRRDVDEEHASIHIIRSASSSDPDVNRKDIVAPMPIMTYVDGSKENIEMHIFFDNSVLEIFVNGRTVITTRIYCDNDETNMVSLINKTTPHRGVNASSSACSTKVDRENRAQIDKAEAWVGLQNAMIVKDACLNNDACLDGDAASRL